MADAHPVSAVLRALANPTRRAVFERIAQTDEITVLEFTQGSGVTQGAVSQHLRPLNQAGLVVERPEGRRVFYLSRPEGPEPLANWMSHYDAFWRERFADLRSVLEEVDP